MTNNNLPKGYRVEKAQAGSIVIETTYDENGRVVEQIKYVKIPSDARKNTPSENREQRPQ